MKKVIIFSFILLLAIVVSLPFVLKPIVISKIEDKATQKIGKKFEIVEIDYGISNIYLKAKIENNNILIKGSHGFGDIDVDVSFDGDTKVLSNLIKEKLDTKLDIKSHIKKDDDIIHVSGIIKTQNETLNIKELVYNIDDEKLKSYYDLDIKDIKNLSYKLDQNISANIIANGIIDIDKDTIKSNSIISTNNEKIELKELVYNLQNKELKTNYNINIKELANTTYKLDQNLSGNLAIDGNMIYKKDITLYAHTSSLGGDININLNPKDIKVDVKNVEIDKILKILNKPPLIKSAKVSGDIVADVKILKDTNLTNLDAKVNLQSRDIMLQGFDLDGVLRGLKNTQSTTLVDVASFVLLSPVASVALSTAKKSYDIIENLDYTKKSQIYLLNAKSTITKGVANMDDVAFKTKNYTMATRGKIDLANQTFDGFSVALVDEEGCATFRQEIEGSFKDPQISTVKSGLKVIAGTITNILEKATQIVTNSKCEVYYNGVVK